MNARSAVLAAFLLTVAACEPREERSATPEPTPSRAPARPVASVMRRAVIEEVAPSPTPTPTPTPRATSVVVLFERGAALDEAARAKLDGLVEETPSSAEKRFVLRGSSDASGSDERNLLISRRRAEAVRDYLVKRGIDRDDIEVIALGERRPVAPNASLSGADNPDGRRLNRRVDVEVLPPAAQDQTATEAIVGPN